MKVAVTAVSGQLGTAITKEVMRLVGKENTVGIARTPAKAATLGIEIRRADYDSKEQFTKALKGIDAVVIISGMAAPLDRIQQHRNIIEAAKTNNIKKLVYTSIIGDSENNDFSPIVQSNRQTEEDIKRSGLDWVIGRNGIYIEPDLEYIEQYIKDGMIYNSADKGKCAYTSRKELAAAYAKMTTEEKHNGQTYNLVGEPITQKELAKLINKTYSTSLIYKATSEKNYTKERKEELGEFLGTIIGGIYEGIRNDAFNVVSHYHLATGRAHKSPEQMIEDYRQNN